MLFYLIWILVGTAAASGGGTCGVCGGHHTGGHGDHQSNGYPTWFPALGYDKTNQAGYSPEYQYYPSGYDSSGYYPTSSSGHQQTPLDKVYYGQVEKGYPNYQGNGLYDTGFNGYQQSWHDKGSSRYPATDRGYSRVDYNDADIYSRRGYKTPDHGAGSIQCKYPCSSRVKKQSSAPAKEKGT